MGAEVHVQTAAWWDFLKSVGVKGINAWNISQLSLSVGYYLCGVGWFILFLEGLSCFPGIFQFWEGCSDVLFWVKFADDPSLLLSNSLYLLSDVGVSALCLRKERWCGLIYCSQIPLSTSRAAEPKYKLECPGQGESSLLPPSSSLFLPQLPSLLFHCQESLQVSVNKCIYKLTSDFFSAFVLNFLLRCWISLGFQFAL